MENSQDGRIFCAAASEKPASSQNSSIQQNPSNSGPYLFSNYVIHCLEGGLFMAGMIFVATDTIMPPMVKELGGAPWLISLMPMMFMLGFVIPPMLNAHLIQNLKWLKPIVMFYAPIQRLPYLWTGLALFLIAEKWKGFTLFLVSTAPFFAAFLGSVPQTAWQRLVAKTVPPNRLCSLWAIRNMIASGSGIVGGAIIAAVLNKYPGPPGFGILHFINLGFLMISYAIFALLRETQMEQSKHRNTITLSQSILEMWDLVKADPQLLNFIRARMFLDGIFIMLPFLSIHALAVMGKPQSYLGFFVTAQMTGAIAGNIFAGIAGDRHGGKLPILASRSLILAACIVAAFAWTPWMFIVVFIFLGFSFNGNTVGQMTLCIEISPPEKRSAYLAVINAAGLPSMLFFAFVSTLIWKTTGSFAILALLTALCMACSLYFISKVREPRKKLNDRSENFFAAFRDDCCGARADHVGPA